MNICGKCKKETTNNPLPIPNRLANGDRGEGFKDIVRCNDCFKEGLKNVLGNLIKEIEK